MSIRRRQHSLVVQVCPNCYIYSRDVHFVATEVELVIWEDELQVREERVEELPRLTVQRVRQAGALR